MFLARIPAKQQKRRGTSWKQKKEGREIKLLRITIHLQHNASASSANARWTESLSYYLHYVGMRPLLAPGIPHSISSI